MKNDFVKDNDKELFNQIFNNKKIKEIHIDTYMDSPYVLFARIIEKNLLISNENNRMIIRKNDRYKTVIVNIFFDEIEDCRIKQYTDNQYEILFGVRNIYYKILVIM